MAVRLSDLLAAASKGDVGRVIEIADAFPEIISLRGELEGHDGFRTERGAETDPRESQFDAPPIGWAAKRGMTRVVTRIKGTAPLSTSSRYKRAP